MSGKIVEYNWLFGATCVWAFIDAYGIGANDVANSFASSVGAKTLSLKQACLIASVTEFAGAFLLGANTASTLSKGVIDMDQFRENPPLLMLAMFCALVGSSTWTLIATRMGWPVSTSQAIIGAIVGVGISKGGLGTVNWGITSFSGVTRIVASWFLSPVTAGLVACSIFLTTRWLVLRHENAFSRALNAIPVYFGVTAFINSCYILLHKADFSDTDTIIRACICVGITVLVVLFCTFLFVPFIRRKLIVGEHLRFYHVFVIPFLPKQKLTADMTEEAPKILPDEGDSGGIMLRLKKRVDKVFDVDIHHPNDKHVQRIMDTAVRYDADTEYMYSILQVATACMSSFAHGSNDIANAVGPLATVYNVWSNGGVPESIHIPIWVLVLGACAMDVGLLTYGYKIFQSLGGKITYLSPSRGFSMELGTSLTVVTCSRIGLPVSTTHCITGATAAVGLCNGSAKSINWRMLGWCLFSWFLTLPAAGCTAGVIFFLCSRSPSV